MACSACGQKTVLIVDDSEFDLFPLEAMLSGMCGVMGGIVNKLTSLFRKRIINCFRQSLENVIEFVGVIALKSPSELESIVVGIWG